MFMNSREQPASKNKFSGAPFHSWKNAQFKETLTHAHMHDSVDWSWVGVQRNYFFARNSENIDSEEAIKDLPIVKVLI